MNDKIADGTVPPLINEVLKPAHELPHGLIAPPDRVREIVAAQKGKFTPELFTAAAEERLLNDLILQCYFEDSGREVLYRSTPEGPHVLAVGFDEIQALRRTMRQEERRQLSTWMP